MATASAFAELLDSTLTGPPPIVHRLLGKARFGVMMGEASELFGRAGDPDPTGNVRFYTDVYDRDKGVLQALDTSYSGS